MGLAAATPDFDVLIVGAGLSGIGAAWHLQDRLPGKSYAIVEARDAIGGTWDLFRYPGIRSDSDMHTLGYSFRPWREQKAIADGPSILAYVRDTAREGDIERHIRFHHKVVRVSWDSAEAVWTLTAETPDGERRLTGRFLMLCAGYYSYDDPHNPPLKGEESFAGDLFHAQLWPEDLDWRGRRAVVIGSGATAVTIVPEMAKGARHVTMLQRSPTWMVSRPSKDRIANFARRILPARWAYGLTRWKNVILGRLFYRLSRNRPDKANARVLKMLERDLDRETIERHFTPSYNVWDQRVCLVPDGDFFQAMKAGRVDVVTDHVERVDEGGIRLASGGYLPADIIVKATGLRLQLLGGAEMLVDGRRIVPGETFSYRGMMLDRVPNAISVFGYTNASWTLKADLSCEYACRLLAEMDRRGTPIAVPLNDDPMLEPRPWLDFSSGYVQRAAGVLPRQGSRLPWKLHQDYLADRKLIREAPLDDGVLRFMEPAPRRLAEAPPPAPAALEAAE